MTTVNVATYTSCDGTLEVGVIVDTDPARGEYKIDLWGSAFPGSNLYNVTTGGPGPQSILITDLPHLEPGDYTVGATITFSDGFQSSSGIPVPITVPGGCATTTTELPATTVAQTTTTIRIEDTLAPTTVVTISDGGPTIPTTIAQTTLVGTPRPTLPATGASGTELIVPGAIGIIVLGGLFVWLGRRK